MHGRASCIFVIRECLRLHHTQYYQDGKRQVDLDFVLTKKQAMQYFLFLYSDVLNISFWYNFHKILLPSTAINNLLVTPYVPCITTFVNLHAIVRQKIIVAVFLGKPWPVPFISYASVKNFRWITTSQQYLKIRHISIFWCHFHYFLLFNAVSKNKNNYNFLIQI